jgi:biopolymer transport protein ExbD
MENQANRDQDQEVSEVNVIPLADVCLVLVIIIMLISPMTLQSMIQVQAAQAVAQRMGKQKVPEKPLFVDVTPAGFSLNNTALGTEYELYRALQRELSTKIDKTVLITAADNVRYENVVRVLDLIKQSGAQSLSLVPRKKGLPS